MKWWMKKITVVLIAILTLGLYVPPIYLDADLEKVDKGEVAPNNEDTPVSQATAQIEAPLSVDQTTNHLYLQSLNERAKQQVIEKLGERIASKMNEELEDVVLPNIESVLDHYYEEIGEKDSQFLMIAEEPSPGYGERIFNLHHAETKSDVARFHVNRLKRPNEGYYFQFHYHSKVDNYEQHNQIAEIYWGKNTPPKWMT
ncbi:YpjP family protein [Gracilibacillus sp. YIM 98692]|uniref:YpjP family protein n=1 Tax=Gracilibacillus sp. YIM 98692 TaxID=2663532 RepID=UPI0013D36EA5|nr:YpjP family protein [Gracilibacillus sp. YIM 98692]